MEPRSGGEGAQRCFLPGPETVRISFPYQSQLVARWCRGGRTVLCHAQRPASGPLDVRWTSEGVKRGQIRLVRNRVEAQHAERGDDRRRAAANEALACPPVGPA